MIGKEDMGLYGWKQLVLWSLEHACLTDDEKARILGQWELQWELFLHEVIETYGEVVEKKAAQEGVATLERRQ